MVSVSKKFALISACMLCMAGTFADTGFDYIDPSIGNINLDNVEMKEGYIGSWTSGNYDFSDYGFSLRKEYFVDSVWTMIHREKVPTYDDTHGRYFLGNGYLEIFDTQNPSLFPDSIATWLATLKGYRLDTALYLHNENLRKEAYAKVIADVMLAAWTSDRVDEGNVNALLLDQENQLKQSMRFAGGQGNTVNELWESLALSENTNLALDIYDSASFLAFVAELKGKSVPGFGELGFFMNFLANGVAATRKEAALSSYILLNNVVQMREKCTAFEEVAASSTDPAFDNAWNETRVLYCEADARTKLYEYFQKEINDRLFTDNVVDTVESVIGLATGYYLNHAVSTGSITSSAAAVSAFQASIVTWSALTVFRGLQIYDDGLKTSLEDTLSSHLYLQLQERVEEYESLLGSYRQLGVYKRILELKKLQASLMLRSWWLKKRLMDETEIPMDWTLAGELLNANLWAQRMGIALTSITGWENYRQRIYDEYDSLIEYSRTLYTPTNQLSYLRTLVIVAEDPPVESGTPVAVISSATNTTINTNVALSGSSSAVSGGGSISSYIWRIVQKPVGSNTTLSMASGVTSGIIPDVAGAYAIELTVTAGSKSHKVIRNIIATKVYSEPELVELQQGRFAYVNINLGKCELRELGTVVVPSGEYWSSITFAVSRGKDIVLLADDDETPSKDTSKLGCPNYTQQFDSDEEYDLFKQGGFPEWTRDLLPGARLRLAVFSYEGISNYQFTMDISVKKDADGDLVPDSRDVFPNDAAASLDTDNDGYPDAWNSGKTAANSTTGLFLDAFPADPAASVDSDSDGFPDQWLPGKTAASSTTNLALDSFPLNGAETSDSDGDGVGDNADAFPDDAAASVDSDGDGYPDAWNTGKSQANSSTGLVLDSFPTDAAAALDSDGDGYPDKWTLGKNKGDSNLNLVLDAFPSNPSEWMDTDGDGFGDAGDAFPFNLMEWLDSDSDGVGDNADPDPFNGERSGNTNPIIQASSVQQMETQEELTLVLNVSDPDGDELSVQLVGAPIFVEVIENSLYFTPSAESAGEYSFVVLVSDAYGASASTEIQLLVDESDGIPDPLQTVTVRASDWFFLGAGNTISVYYDTSDQNSALTGLGLRIHVDSTILKTATLSNVFTKDLVGVDVEWQADVNNLDGITSTDSFLNIAWGSIGGNWPGILPVKLFDLEMTARDDVTVDDEIVVGFSTSNNAEGYDVALPIVNLTTIQAGLDVDGNGEVGALTDALMIVRSMFGFNGEAMIDRAVAADAVFKDVASIEARIKALDSVLDIDGNGQIGALTDGLLIMRYVFGFRGNVLVNDVVGSGATRSSDIQIETYLSNLIPLP